MFWGIVCGVLLFMLTGSGIVGLLVGVMVGLAAK